MWKRHDCQFHWHEPLLKFCMSREIKGTLLLADEGINGTVSGSEKSILELLNYLKTD